MMKYTTLLFDLDGTLTDSEEGILNCVRHALTTGGFPVPEYAMLKAFIGPPLLDSFQDICGMTFSEAEAAVVRYRERFSTVGLFENRVYEGIPELLRELKEAGYRLAVATSKPEVYTLRILAHFGLLEDFEVIAGCCLEKEGETKADMIRLALTRLGLSEADKPYVLMIGDRKHDILGARACGIACAGVRYGYAPELELEQYGADPIVKDVAELRAFLLSQNQRAAGPLTPPPYLSLETDRHQPLPQGRGAKQL